MDHRAEAFLQRLRAKHRALTGADPADPTFRQRRRALLSDTFELSLEARRREGVQTESNGSRGSRRSVMRRRPALERASALRSRVRLRRFSKTWRWRRLALSARLGTARAGLRFPTASIARRARPRSCG
jgi:hypothetical protein